MSLSRRSFLSNTLKAMGAAVTGSKLLAGGSAVSGAYIVSYFAPGSNVTAGAKTHACAHGGVFSIASGGCANCNTTCATACTTVATANGGTYDNNCSTSVCESAGFGYMLCSSVGSWSD